MSFVEVVGSVSGPSGRIGFLGADDSLSDSEPATRNWERERKAVVERERN